jgi:xylulokinase
MAENKYIITIDLGTTLIKFGLFDENLREICIHSLSYDLKIDGNYIEFDALQYWELCLKGMDELLLKSGINRKNAMVISLSSQAETIVPVDINGNPLRNAISWLDSRSAGEVDAIRREFDVEKAYGITGQPDIITTWPASKILWMKSNEKQIYDKAYKFLLLKDFIIYKLTGQFVSEFSIYNFSYYFDINKKNYWNEMLKFLGIDIDKLPELKEPGEKAGLLAKENSEFLNLATDVVVNCGCLDQMAGMIGTGNIRPGVIGETTGTVMVICAVVNKPNINKYRIPCHYNAVKNTYVMLPIVESGGISLEWFKNNFADRISFKQMDLEVKNLLPRTDDPVFLPYIVGVNSPEYNPDARGVFYGLSVSHNNTHLAKAVMEGICFILKKNLRYLGQIDIESEKIISSGGGSNSDVWNQMKADILDKEVMVMESKEAASLGCAILGAVDIGFFSNVEEAVKKVVRVKTIYQPNNQNKSYYEKQYELFLDIYDRLYK